MLLAEESYVIADASVSLHGGAPAGIEPSLQSVSPFMGRARVPLTMGATQDHHTQGRSVDVHCASGVVWEV